MPEPEPETRTLFVRMPSVLHDAVRRAAEAEDRTMSQFIRKTLTENIVPVEGPAPCPDCARARTRRPNRRSA